MAVRTYLSKSLNFFELGAVYDCNNAEISEIIKEAIPSNHLNFWLSTIQTGILNGRHARTHLVPTIHQTHVYNRPHIMFPWKAEF